VLAGEEEATAQHVAELRHPTRFQEEGAAKVGAARGSRSKGWNPRRVATILAEPFVLHAADW
jgi:hypothetical protein